MENLPKNSVYITTDEQQQDNTVYVYYSNNKFYKLPINNYFNNLILNNIIQFNKVYTFDELVTILKPTKFVITMKNTYEPAIFEPPNCRCYKHNQLININGMEIHNHRLEYNNMEIIIIALLSTNLIINNKYLFYTSDEITNFKIFDIYDYCNKKKITLVKINNTYFTHSYLTNYIPHFILSDEKKIIIVNILGNPIYELEYNEPLNFKFYTCVPYGIPLMSEHNFKKMCLKYKDFTDLYNIPGQEEINNILNVYS